MRLDARGDPWELEYVETGESVDPGALRVRVWASRRISDAQLNQLKGLFNAWRQIGGWHGFGDGGRINDVLRFGMQPEPDEPILDAVLDLQGGNDLAVNVLLWSLDGARHLSVPISRVRIGED